MGTRHNTNSSFWIRCVGYTQNRESFFTIGEEYEVTSGGFVTSDHGHTYVDPKMKPDSDPESWFLSSWYLFEIVDDATAPEHFDISFEDVLGIT